MPRASSSFQKNKSPSKDDWYGVEDPKRRKQIQDRLAQRARRKRLADAKRALDSETPKSNSGASGHLETSPEKPLPLQPSPRECKSASPLRPSDVTIPSYPSKWGYTLGTLDTRSRTFLSALFNNGSILGLSCGSSFPFKSPPARPDVPYTLHPTILQLSTVHWQWIDRFPFADFRDEIIVQSSNVNEEEFLEDLFNMDSFHIAHDVETWDPSAYTICPNFQRKWGFLFPSFSLMVDVDNGF